MHSYVSWDFLVEIEDNCLNPCFNGRCTRTLEETTNETNATGVLILVLMEDALVRSWLGYNLRPGNMS